MRNQLPPTGSFRQVCKYLGLNEDEFKGLGPKDDFPRPTKAGNHQRWAFAEIDEWLEEQRETAA